MDSLNKHVEKNSFRQRITFCEHRHLKGWQPRFQPTVAKAQSRHISIVDMEKGEKTHSNIR